MYYNYHLENCDGKKTALTQRVISKEGEAQNLQVEARVKSMDKCKFTSFDGLRWRIQKNLNTIHLSKKDFVVHRGGDTIMRFPGAAQISSTASAVQQKTSKKKTKAKALPESKAKALPENTQVRKKRAYSEVSDHHQLQEDNRTVRGLTEELERVKKERDDVRRENGSLREEIDDERRENGSLRRENGSLRHTVHGLKEELQRVRKEDADENYFNTMLEDNQHPALRYS